MSASFLRAHILTSRAVFGGAWLIKEQSHLSFHICAIMPRDGELNLKYDLPSNVIGLTTIRLNDLAPGASINASLASRMHNGIACAAREID